MNDRDLITSIRSYLICNHTNYITDHMQLHKLRPQMVTGILALKRVITTK